MNQNKRCVSKELKFVLEKDAELTEYFVDSVKDILLFKSLKIHQSVIKITCGGILWLSTCLGSIWIFGNRDLYQLQLNMLFALIVDIIVVALLKAQTRRRKPNIGQGHGRDKLSMPSGKVSRATLINYIFNYLYPLPFAFTLPLLGWVVAVSVSRIVSEEHHILDVIAGIVLGVVEGYLFSWIWLSEDISKYIISYITDVD